MASLSEIAAGVSNSESRDSNYRENMEWFGGEDAGWAMSMLAGIPSGIFKIAEGIATLGATLMDLGVDRDRAESVEEFFDKINPFDEAASATAVGKITELIVNLGVPGAPAFRIGSGLTKAALRAKETGKAITGMEKLRRYGQGAAATGLTDAIFIGDVEAAGSFGDWMGGPTEIDRKSDTPYAELLNRLKFGIEGAAFAGAIGGVGAGIGKIRSQAGTGKAITDPFDKFFDKIGAGLRSRGDKNPNQFKLDMARKGEIDADIRMVDNWRDAIDKFSGDLARKYSKVALNKTDEVATRNSILKEMNDTLMSGSSKDGKMLPSFGLVDEIARDPTTGFAFKNGRGVLKDLPELAPLPTQAKIPDPVTGKEILENTKTGKQLYNVTIDEMDPAKVKALRDNLIKKYKADPKEVTNLLDTFVAGREKFAELFTRIGRRFTPEAWEAFTNPKTGLPRYLNDVVDRGYSVFRNNAGQKTVALNYPPTKAVLKETFDFYKAQSIQKGLKVSDEVLERAVQDTWQNATMRKGLTFESKAGPAALTLPLPRFLSNSMMSELGSDPTIIKSTTTNLSDVTGVAVPVIKKLLGKSENPMSTLVDGITNLSTQVHSGEFFDNMVKKSNQLKVAYDDWLAAGKVGPEPEVPFLFNSRGEGHKYAGGAYDDIQPIIKETPTGDAARALDRFVDQKMPLKPVDELEAVYKAEINKITNPLEGKWALAPVAASFKPVDEWMKGLPQQIYNNLVLYPKGTSQMAKTILAPFTHARNFISATAFAGANGHLPFGNTADVKAAWRALQAAGPGMKQSNEFYQELVRLGVVNSSVRLNQVIDLLKDAKFGEILNNKNSDWALNKLMKRFKAIKKGAEDYYTAEDDFWKIFTFLGEKSKMKKAYHNAGLRLGQEFTDINGVKRLFNDRTINELSADLVKNNVPNYAFVSDFVKGLRKFPLGNFIAFPAEIMRTGANIIDTGLKEINYTTIINGKTVKPFAARGRQRLMGMALTTAALPIGTVAAAETVYDITKDETQAMKRYVADWSKNSVLIPFKDDEGKLSYIDFSHLNAYDTLTRPIMTVLNKVEQGRADEDGIMDDFILGLIESTKELGAPFISESIWTEALQDVAPVLGRNGTDSEGRRIWNPEDSLGDKFYKAMGHLIEAQAPLNWRQLQRLGLSIYPIDSQGRFDERGIEYEFGNELAGIAGMRRVEINPVKSFTYKVTDYKKGIRNSRNLFTSATLKGGPVTPQEIVEAYINANRALYEVNRELYQDIQAAKVLGMSEDRLRYTMERRGENRAFRALNEAVFRPLNISSDVRQLFELKATELGIANPYDRARDAIDRIRDILSNTSLRGDFFPELNNPFDTSIIPPLPDFTTQLPDVATLTAAAPGFTGQGNVNTNAVNQANLYSALYPNDDLARLYNLKQNQKPNRIV